MASSSDSNKGKQGALSPRTARARMEEAMEKLDLTTEESTPLVINDLEDGEEQKWSLAGKVLYKNTLHI